MAGLLEDGCSIGPGPADVTDPAPTHLDIFRMLVPAKQASTVQTACPDMETVLHQLECGVEFMSTLVYVFNHGDSGLWHDGNFARHMYACHGSLKHFLAQVEQQREAMQKAIDALPDEPQLSVPKATKAKKEHAKTEQPVPA